MGKDSTNAGCNLFRAMTEDPERVTSLVRSMAATDLRSRLAPQLMRPLETSFVEEDFRDNHCDRLVEAALRDGSLLLIHLIWDNRDAPDPDTPKLLYAYTQRIWRWYREERPDGPPLTGVLPLLLYTGRKKWDIPLKIPVSEIDNGTDEPAAEPERKRSA